MTREQVSHEVMEAWRLASDWNVMSDPQKVNGLITGLALLLMRCGDSERVMVEAALINVTARQKYCFLGALHQPKESSR